MINNLGLCLIDNFNLVRDPYVRSTKIINQGLSLFFSYKKPKFSAKIQSKCGKNKDGQKKGRPRTSLFSLF